MTNRRSEQPYASFLPSAARLAVDIGGTFTDLVVEGPQGRISAKVLTTPRAPEEAVMQGLRQLLADAGLRPAAIGLFIHGTTLATNALIERRGARTAFLTTAGMRDILEMGYEKRFEQYDVFLDKPAPLVPRSLRFEVDERISARGEVLRALDETAFDCIADALEREGVESLAIGFMHAWRHGEHESRARDLIVPRLPRTVTVCLSSEVCPEIREYERFSTTVANAYVRPLMSRYLLRLRDMLAADGFGCPLFLMMSGGGLTTLEQAARFPIRLLESGPAGGAIFAASVAAELDMSDVLSFDMGGTTAKICLIEGGRPEHARSFEAAREYRNVKGSGLPIRIPSIEMVEIGAGGGSIAAVDALGRVQVGPHSAGSEPGPVCYGRGGDRPAVTDANLLLGRLDPLHFAAGSIRLDVAAAKRSLARDVGEPLGLTDHWPAVAVSEIVEENMANAARVHAIERGKVLGRFAMVAYGGGAPLHAAQLATKLGIDTVIVPRGAGVGSAIGFLRAPFAYEVVRSHRVRLDGFDAEAARALLAAMRDEAAGVVQRGRAMMGDARADQPAALDVVAKISLRYEGQGHELTMALPVGGFGEGGSATFERFDASIGHWLRERFESQYHATYGLVLADMPVEAVSWSVTVGTPLAPATSNEPPAAAPPSTALPSTAPWARRRMYDAGRSAMSDCAAPLREALRPGDRVVGPAVIAEDETSTIVPTGFTAEMAFNGHLILRRADRHD